MADVAAPEVASVMALAAQDLAGQSSDAEHSAATSATAPKRRGRPRKLPVTLGAGLDSRATTPVLSPFSATAPAATRGLFAAGQAASGSAPASSSSGTEERLLDPLSAREVDAFGDHSIDGSLPPPPNGLVGTTAAAGVPGALAGVKRSLGAAMPSAASNRPKRPKNVKFSPAKSGKGAAKKALPGGMLARSAAASDSDQLPNNDYCDACLGKGDFLCCDGGCLRSFHFTCLDPPVLNVDDLGDVWFCKQCQAKRLPPPKGTNRLFSELIYRVEVDNPKVFDLPAEYKTYFREVAAGTSGEYINLNSHRKPPTGREKPTEDRSDGFRQRDRGGRLVLCFHCREPASVVTHRRILSCDFCDKHWHLDCLDPPLTALPPAARKWMCPVHITPVLPKERQTKQTTTVQVRDRSVANNGDLLIIPRSESNRIMEDCDEVVLNRIRYQIPEDTVILDFWNRVRGDAPKLNILRSPSRKALFNHHKAFQAPEPGSPLSSLTSLDDLSDDDAPEPPVMDRFLARTSPSIEAAYYDTSALDSLAKLAQEELDVGWGSGEPESSTRRTVSPPRLTSNGLVLKLAPRNGHHLQPSVVSPGSRLESSVFSSGNTSDSSDALQMPRPDHKGKGRAIEVPMEVEDPYGFAQPHRASASPRGANGLVNGTAAAARRGRLSSGSLVTTTFREVAPLPSSRKQRTKSDARSTFSLSSDLRGEKRGRGDELARSDTPSSRSSQSSTSRSRSLEVASKEDLQAIMRVKKLLAEAAKPKAAGDGVPRKRDLLDFLEGELIVPKLAYLDGAVQGPWSLPWEGTTVAPRRPVPMHSATAPIGEIAPIEREPPPMPSSKSLPTVPEVDVDSSPAKADSCQPEGLPVVEKERSPVVASSEPIANGLPALVTSAATPLPSPTKSLNPTVARLAQPAAAYESDSGTSMDLDSE